MKFYYFCLLVYNKQQNANIKKKMDMVKKIILTDREAQRKILDTFGVTRMSLSYALNYKRNSDKCKQMRKMAMELGGILLEERSAT
mgnify:CR=1 FL=1